METIPLPVWPPVITDERMSLLRAAKAMIDTDVKVVPVPAAYGSPGRILAFERPPFICRCAPIAAANVDNVESVAAALQFILDDFGSDAYTEAWWLSGALGCDVTLLHEEDEHGVVMFT